MERFQRVCEILDDAIGGPDADIGVHGPFWRGLDREQFVAKKVFGRPLLVVGDGAASNLVRALAGEAPFGADLAEPPEGASFSRMPAGMAPVAPESVAFVKAWIDDGCPEDVAPAVRPVWRPTGAPVASSRTDDIWFTDPLRGWAVNSNGQIVHTTDGFTTFEVQFHDPELYLRCVGFADASRGWVGTLTPGTRLLEDHVFVHLDRVGNTSAASIPPALADLARSDAVASGDRVVLTVLGGGLTWGSTALVWSGAPGDRI